MSSHPQAAPHPAPSGGGRWRWALFAVLVVLCGFGYHFTERTTSSTLKGGNPVLAAAALRRFNQDQNFYQTASSLGGMADYGNERAYAAQAQHYADELVDLSFAIALEVEAEAQAAPGAAPDPAAQARITRARAAVAADQLSLRQSRPATVGLAVAQAQLELDQARLQDAISDASRGSDGTDRLQRLQQEHESLHKLADGGGDALAAEASARNPRTARGLVGELHAALLLTDKLHRLEDAEAAVRAAIPGVIAEHDRLHARLAAEEAALKAAPAAASSDRVDRLHSLAQQQVQISRFDSQADVAGELADAYAHWEPIAVNQRTAALHAALSELLVILAILGVLGLFLALLDQGLRHARWERKRALMLRHVLGLCAEVFAAICLLMVFFGQPTQLLTIIGLAGAALTVAFQDAILSLAGWFILIGRGGVHLGDWVEINGVQGEVTEIRLLRTVLLETGNWITPGHPTGRRVFFPNSFALKGSYFNYSTAGQWLWDELATQVPDAVDPHRVVAEVEAAIRREIGDQAETARHEWQQQWRHMHAQAPFSTAPTVLLRPSADGHFTLVVRYTTPAQQRTAMRERLWTVMLQAISAAAHTPADAAAPVKV